MGDIVRSTTNDNCVILTPRSATHSIATAALIAWYPNQYLEFLSSTDGWHPAAYLPQENWDGTQSTAIIVRNPIERFRSMVAHRPELTLAEHLSRPYYTALPHGSFIRIFKFETQLDECADWLGLPTPLIHEDKSDPTKKPNLTPEQESIVRSIYAKDIELWESLNA